MSHLELGGIFSVKGLRGDKRGEMQRGSKAEARGAVTPGSSCLQNRLAASPIAIYWLPKAV